METTKEQEIEILRKAFMETVQKHFNVIRLEHEDAYILSMDFKVSRESLVVPTPDALYNYMAEELKAVWKSMIKDFKPLVDEQYRALT